MMRNDNYPSASEMVRNLSDIRVRHELLHVEGKFRVIRFERPFFQGSEFWVVNEKGFMWEPADSLDAAMHYLKGSEAAEYQKAWAQSQNVP
jgi:hypothetical protein